MQKIKVVFLTLSLLLCVLSLFAQQSFKYKVGLQKVDSNGFYRVDLQPDLVAGCKEDLSDLRLVGKQNKFFPYINSNQLPKNQSRFIAFAHIVNPLKSDTLSSYIIKNPNHEGISELWLKLRNTAVKRTVNVLGSDDLNNWYAIKENVQLQEAGLNKDGNYEQQLSFPSSTYLYIKIQVNDKSRTPINILEAGSYLLNLSKTRYVLLPKINFVQKDSGKISYVTVTFPKPYQVNKLHLDLSGTKFFSRQFGVYLLSGKNHDLIINTTLSSMGSKDLYLQAKTRKLEIEIDNEDSPPLVINAINTYQLNRSIIVYLEKNQSYNLVFGDEKAQAPKYDLQSFVDSLPEQLPELKHSSVITNPYYKSIQAKSDNFPKWIIWIAIVIALSILTILTLKMMKEVNKSSVE